MNSKKNTEQPLKNNVVWNQHNRPLTDQELQAICDNWTDSEDGLEVSDSDSVADPNYIPSDVEEYEGGEDHEVMENEEVPSHALHIEEHQDGPSNKVRNEKPLNSKKCT